MNGREARKERGRGTFEARDHRDLEIERLEGEIERLRERERAARAEAETARRHFSDLSAMSKRFAVTMRGGMAERRQYRRRLGAQLAVSRILAEAHDLGEAAPKVFEVLGERLGWEVGALWTVESGGAGSVLRLAGIWRYDDRPAGVMEEASGAAAFRRGVGLPGRVWERDEPVWVEDVLADDDFARKAAAAEDGLRGALAFPIRDGGVVGVFELFRAEVLPPDEGLMRTAALIGEQTGQFVERRRAEGQRDDALARERAARREASEILESINDGFFALDPRWRFTYVNRRASQLLDRAPGDLIGETIWEAYPGFVGGVFERAYRRAADERAVTSVTSFYPDHDRWYDVRVYPAPEGITVYFRDVSERVRTEEALRESEERFRNMADHAPMMTWVTGPDGNSTFLSQSWYEFTGQTPETGLGLGWLEAVHPDDRERGTETFLAAHERREPFSLDYRLLRHDGEYRWAIDSAQPRRGENGEFLGHIGSVIDITERKLAEEAVRESEERYRTLFESMDEGFCVIEMMFDAGGEPTDYRFLEVNPAFERETGLREASGKTARELVPDLDAHWFEIYGNVALTGEPVRFVDEARAMDGRWFDVYAFRLGGEESRKVALLFNNVTERKLAEEEREKLRREAEAERARLVAILQQMPGGVFIADHFGRMILINEGATRIYQKRLRSVEECGHHALSYPNGREIPPDDYPLARALRGESVSGVEHYVLRADGTRGVVRTNAAPVRDEGGRVVAAVKAFEDVTRYKEASRALRKSEERLRAVVEGAPVILFSLDSEGVYTLAEGEGLRGLGIEPGEPVGRSVFELFGDAPEVMATVRRALAGETFVANVSMRDRVFEVWYSPLREEGGALSGVIGVATDVTERELAEEERDRSRVAELVALAEVDEAQKRLAFYAGAREERRMISRELHDRVAHSMAVVRQCLELYEAFRDRDPHAAAAKLEQAKEEAKSALSATRDLSMMLRRSEIEGGLGKALSDLLETTIPSDVRYEVDVEGDEAAVPAHVGNQLFLIMREAIRNAVTHSGCERVTVGLRLSPNGVVGAVEDDGLGFEEDGNGGPGGGGVGLRSMKERAALLGGVLRVSSKPDAGTKVEVSVPLTTEEDAR